MSIMYKPSMISMSIFVKARLNSEYITKAIFKNIGKVTFGSSKASFSMLCTVNIILMTSYYLICCAERINYNCNRGQRKYSCR